MASAKIFQLSADEIVTIHVGPKQKNFTVHKKLLCDRSEFFSKAFNGEFKEATDGVMYLPEDDADAFDSMIVYIYQNLLPVFPNLECDEYLETILYPLFALAEKLCLNELANRVMDLIQDTGLNSSLVPGNEPGGGNYMIYTLTPVGSKLRVYSVLMQVYIQHASTTETVEEADAEMGKELAELARHHPDFATDYIKLMWKYRARFQKVNPPADAQVRNSEKGFGRCFFHTHHKDEVCHLDTDATDK
ncbi:hypothetical protein DL95DRAFT_408542 [Leptodontidium sp. 2 PMI_412]|nr:hypothetical protein DL95DRAFT_408542 [Leptodontidium sp. 2 PMI_412]